MCVTLCGFGQHSVQLRSFSALDVATQPQSPAVALKYDWASPANIWAPKSFQGLPQRADASKAFVDVERTFKGKRLREWVVWFTGCRLLWQLAVCLFDGWTGG